MKIVIKLFPSILFLLIVVISCNTTKIVYKKKIIKDTITQVKKFQIPNNIAKVKDYKISIKYYPADSQNYRVKYLIMHYTVSDYQTSLKALTKINSAHYLISDVDNDSIEILVSEENRAWHAGISNWENDKNLNDTSIGIEIVNPGYKMIDNKKVYAEFYNYQIKKVAELAQNIIERYKIAPTNVLGHSDIAPQRKQDPGPNFPWKKLYSEYNIGMWYDENDKRNFEIYYPNDSIVNTSTFIAKTQNDFKILGYKIERTGSWDKQTSKVIEIFQYHFRPEDYFGIIDKETWAILQALNKRYRKKLLY